jgi:hypothetical protein
MKPQFLAERLNNIRLRWSGVAHRTIDDTGRRFPLTITLERVMCGSKEVRMKRIPGGMGTVLCRRRVFLPPPPWDDG